MAIIRRQRIRRLSENQNPRANFSESGLRQLALDNGISDEPLDLRALVALLNIRLEIKPMVSDVSGYLKNISGRWVIGVNSLHHPRRQNFTIAHELAHYCLHTENMSDFEDTVLFRNGDSNSVEAQANNFAAELLMPENAFREYISNNSSNIEEIANHFNVSTMAVRVRAKVLNYEGHGLD